MSEVRLTLAEKNQFVGVDSTKHAVVISAQDENNAEGMKPSDLLLLALGSCGAVDIVRILKKKRQMTLWRSLKKGFVYVKKARWYDWNSVRMQMRT